jgi:hypothetical protein
MVSSKKLGFFAVLALVTRVAQAEEVTDLDEMREYFNLVSMTLGSIPGCPDYASVPDSVIEQSVECLKNEAAAFNNTLTDYATNEYPAPCSSTCRELYAYFGADCLREEDREIVSFGKELQGGSLPTGYDEDLFLAWLNVLLGESDEFRTVDGLNLSYVGDVLVNYPSGTESMIDECGVPKTGTFADGVTDPSGSTPLGWSLAGFLAVAAMLL